MARILRIFLNSLERSTCFSKRGIAMTTTNLNEAVEKLKNNPYFEKYADRIAAIQRTSPEEFLRRVEQNAPPQTTAPPVVTGAVDTRQYSSVLNPKESLQDDVTVEKKKLETIFKLELVKDKNASEIQNIWEAYHTKKEVISATIPLGAFSVIKDRMKDFPTFLLPLPRSQGYEFILCQSFGHNVHFTPLLAFQVHKENAPECLTMVHYTELQDKGIVLMRGEYDKNVLNGQEAQCLANQFQMYYSGKDPVKLQLLETFTTSPDHFKHMDLIFQMENISIV